MWQASRRLVAGTLLCPAPAANSNPIQDTPRREIDDARAPGTADRHARRMIERATIRTDGNGRDKDR
jgi:hypothetical protein